MMWFRKYYMSGQ